MRELRARILYDNGRRPDFRAASGDHVDDQRLDFGAWHFVGRRTADGPPLGYVRLSTPATGEQFQSREYLGPEAYAQLLLDSGLGTGETYEHSRLVVEHHARKLGLGVQLNALAPAAARHLGAKAMVGTSGTKDGQDAFHARFGFQPVKGTRQYVERYTEDVVLLLCRIGEAAGDYSDLVAQYTDLFPQLVVNAQTVRLDVPTMREEEPHTLSAALTLARTALAPDQESWRPEPVEGSRALRTLLASGRVREVHDTIEQQITELVRSREPGPATTTRPNWPPPANGSWTGPSRGSTGAGSSIRGPDASCTCCRRPSSGWCAPTATGARSTGPSSGGSSTAGSA
ncbi:hypothetical protein ABZ835_33230 [Streptomyces sp. NPDC047461]|uniref:hypothetical protein n=1 Tax=Streptomyces sp. NPDC047461 TaxID=3155619 RepID=UPI0033CDDF94